MNKRLGLASVLMVVVTPLSGGCAGKTLREENMTVAPITEYDARVTVKPLETPAPESAKQVVKPKPTPQLGLEGSKKKPKEKSLKAVDNSGKRLPEMEDSEGFSGRRPIVDPIRAGEKVTMVVSYFGVAAGEVTLEVRPFVEVNGRKAYHFHSDVKTSSLFNAFYKVDDQVDGYMDFEQLVPVSFTLSVNESKQLREVRQFFDWKTRKADFWERKVTKEDGTEEKKKGWDLIPFSQDVYSAVHYIRFFQLRDGKTYSYPVSDDFKAWEVKATVIRRETIKTELGPMKAILIQPQVAREGVFKPMGEVNFWYSDDERKFPLRFEAKIKIGKLVGVIKALERGGP
ncbi:MAG: DUF3108 domain-containing protein [Oligoflexia bacterium]|nr:DUF3108 domain-containing protein [Oligoflexia bacterium]